MGDVDKSKLQGPEGLQEPGSKDQQVKMIKNGDIVEAYQWQQSGSKWMKIGEVVDAIGSNRKQTYEGREYDYVFDIEIAEGQTLKLPYNANRIFSSAYLMALLIS